VYTQKALFPGGPTDQFVSTGHGQSTPYRQASVSALRSC
jgi:hypothetical protein